MTITILGTRGNIKPSAPKHAKRSGVLVDDRLLLDLGETEYLRLSSATHLH